MVRFLADSGAKLNETEDSGYSILHFAINGPTEILKVLLESGKDV